MNENLEQVEPSYDVNSNKSNRRTVLLVVFVFGLSGLLALLWLAWAIGLFDGVILSKYDRKIYTIKSSDGKVYGTIGTTVEACSETEKCVLAHYNIIINDDIAFNKINTNPKQSSFDSNYYYTAKISISNKSESEKSMGYIKLSPVFCNQNQLIADPFSGLDNGKRYLCGNVGWPGVSTNKFLLSSFDVLRKSQNSPDDFLKLDRLEIYDASGAIFSENINGNSFERADIKKTIESKNKIKSFDFSVNETDSSFNIRSQINNDSAPVLSGLTKTALEEKFKKIMKLDGYKESTDYETNIKDENLNFFVFYYPMSDFVSGSRNNPEHINLGFKRYVFQDKKLFDEAIKYHYDFFKESAEKIDICGNQGDLAFNATDKKDALRDSAEIIYLEPDNFIIYKIEGGIKANDQFFPNYNLDKNKTHQKLKEDMIKVARLYCESYKK